ncbi:hypothetical protein ACN28S_22070 [Cystobacter fuscus]
MLVPVAGSYSSAEAVPPPATSTLPEGSTVTEGQSRRSRNAPVNRETPSDGSYTSVIRAASGVATPPITSTPPEGSSVAEKDSRPQLNPAMALHEPGASRGHSGSPAKVKAREVDSPSALLTVAVMDGVSPAGTHGGAVQATSLAEAPFTGVPSVPRLADHVKPSALP